MNKKKNLSEDDFNGHLKYNITKMTPKEKLLYLSKQIEIHYFIKNKIKKIK
jgi:hypothetical protein